MAQLWIALMDWSSGSSLPSHAVVSLTSPPLRRNAIPVVRSLYRQKPRRQHLCIVERLLDFVGAGYLYPATREGLRPWSVLRICEQSCCGGRVDRLGCYSPSGESPPAQYRPALT